MTGNADDPKISFDPTRFLEDVQELVKKEYSIDLNTELSTIQSTANFYKE